MLFPTFVALAGNWSLILSQIPHGRFPGRLIWYWDSTRVVWVRGDTTINEFPFFSLSLGDLHPHVLALPVVMIAVACAVQLVLGRSRSGERTRVPGWRLLAIGFVLASLATINSWDYPSYLALVAVCLASGLLLRSSLRQALLPAAISGCLLLIPLVFFAPFFRHFQSLTYGVGLVTTRTLSTQFVEMWGLFLICIAGCLLGMVRASSVVAAQSSVSSWHSELIGRRKPLLLAMSPLLAVILLFAYAIAEIVRLLPLLMLAAVATVAIRLLRRQWASRRLSDTDVFFLVLVVAGAVVLSISEVVYVRDFFDNTGGYRMNTVFKLYYQAWILLGLASAYGAWRGLQILAAQRRRIGRVALAAAVTLGTTGALGYTAFAPTAFAAAHPDPHDTGIDGLAWMERQMPGDYGAVRWLQAHATSNSVLLEAPTRSFDRLSSVAAFSGIPTVLGWSEHEAQWRRRSPEITYRAHEARLAYQTPNPATAEKILHEFGVRYVLLGPDERAALHLGSAAQRKFLAFLQPVYASHGTLLLTWRSNAPVLAASSS
jgi:YYY domain-containing protein